MSHSYFDTCQSGMRFRESSCHLLPQSDCLSICFCGQLVQHNVQLASFIRAALRLISQCTWIFSTKHLNTLRPRQDGRHFADDTFKHIFLNKNVRISIKISLKFVSKGSIDNIPLVQIMAWCQPGDKPLSEPMMIRLLTQICVTWSQWVN